MSNKKGSRMEITEEKKRRAVHLKSQGWLTRDVARDTGIDEGTVNSCWRRWAQEQGMEIITREAPDERDYVPMPVTVRYVEPSPPAGKKAEPVRPETPGVLDSLIRSTRKEAAKEAAAVWTVESEDPMVIEAPEGDRATEVTEVTEVTGVTEEAAKEPEAAPVGTKKSTAPKRMERRADRQAAPAEATARPNSSEIQKIYGLINIINEAVVDYAIEMMVLPDQIGQSVEVSDGIMTMVLSVPVGRNSE